MDNIKEPCSICHNAIYKKNVVITECSHVFHFSCIVKNIKLNPTNGNKCPLCRKSFYEGNLITNIVQRNPVGNTYYRTSIQHRIERRINFAARRRNRIQTHSSRTGHANINRLGRIKKEIRLFIERLNFNQLKDKLKHHNQSSRGYVRTSLEKRLFDKLLQEKLNNSNYIM